MVNGRALFGHAKSGFVLLRKQDLIIVREVRGIVLENESGEVMGFVRAAGGLAFALVVAPGKTGCK